MLRLNVRVVAVLFFGAPAPVGPWRIGEVFSLGGEKRRGVEVNGVFEARTCAEGLPLDPGNISQDGGR